MEQHPIKINKVQIRNLQIEDYDQLAQSFTRVYSDGSDVFWTHKQIEKLIRIFPEGQIVTVVDEKIVGCALSIIVNYDDVKNDHTYAQVTGKETFNTHNPKGNILYGIEVFIHPQYRGLRLARRMYEYRKEICEMLNLKAIMFGGRIPNYHKYADQIRPKEYIDKVKQKEIYDPVLTFQLSNDFHVRKVMRNYLPNDEESKHYACLLQWDNIYYQPPTQEYISPKTTVRVGLVQWQMRTYKTLDDLFEQVEFFVDAVSDYKSDFVLFPEYFNAPLMAKFNDEGESEAIRGLAAYTNEIRERFVKLAISYNINIIPGSMPLIKEEDGRLYNVGFLCRRDGTYEMYEKTPLCVTADSPMVNGAIADGRNLGFILARLLKRFSSVFTKRPDILVTVPMELSEIEMRAFYKVLTGLKVRRIALVEKGVADAVGIGMPVLAQTGSMVVNIGASTTGISVISDGKVIIGRQYPYGGNAMDQAVITMVRREHNLAIGKKTAEKLRVAMGCLMNGEAKSSEVYGIHTISGVPSSARIPSEDISKAITDTADAIADAVKMTLQRIPPQLLENIQQNGIYLAGGVSLTPNIASYIQEKVTFPVYNVPDPVYNTMNGLVEIMNDKELKKLTFSLKDYVGNLI